MIFGVFITHKKYNLTDYAIVMCMVVGLAIFMHADATSSAVFEPLGVILLVRSCFCVALFYPPQAIEVLHTWRKEKMYLFL